MNFIMREPKELHAEMKVDDSSFHFDILPRKSGQAWVIDITLSSPSMVEKKTHTLTLQAFRGAVVGFGLDQSFHRNDQLIDFSNDIDPAIAGSIKKLGEAILLTVTRHGDALTWSLEESSKLTQ